MKRALSLQSEHTGLAQGKKKDFSLHNNRDGLVNGGLASWIQEDLWPCVGPGETALTRAVMPASDPPDKKSPSWV